MILKRFVCGLKQTPGLSNWKLPPSVLHVRFLLVMAEQTSPPIGPPFYHINRNSEFSSGSRIFHWKEKYILYLIKRDTICPWTSSETGGRETVLVRTPGGVSRVEGAVLRVVTHCHHQVGRAVFCLFGSVQENKLFQEFCNRKQANFAYGFTADSITDASIDNKTLTLKELL